MRGSTLVVLIGQLMNITAAVVMGLTMENVTVIQYVAIMLFLTGSTLVGYFYQTSGFMIKDSRKRKHRKVEETK